MSIGMDVFSRVVQVAGSIQASCSRNSIEKITIYQIINRILLLLQEPVFFLMYLKDEAISNDRVASHQLIFCSVECNGIYRQNYHEILGKYHIRKSGTYYLKQEFKKYTFHTDENEVLSFILFSRDAYDKQFMPTVHKQEFEQGQCIVNRVGHLSVYSKIIERSHPASKRFSALWEELSDSEYSKELGYTHQLAELFRAFLQSINRDKKKLKSSPTKNKSSRRIDKALMKKQLNAIDHVVNATYRMIDDAPILSPKGRLPANILFFQKYYTGRHAAGRFYGCFDYDIRIVIPEKQRRDLTKALELAHEAFKGLDEESQYWSYSGSDKEGMSGVMKPIYPKRHYHDQFAAYLDAMFNSDQREANIEDYFERLTGAYTDSTMSLADPSLSTGFITFTQTPFDTNTAGIERLENSGKRYLEGHGKSLEDDTDLLRVISMYYISAAMASSAVDQEEEPHYKILNVPIRVAGCHFLNFSFLLNANDQDQVFWQKSFHFFTDIASYQIKKLRRSLREAYSKELERLVCEAILGYTKGIYNLRPLNNQLSFISRFWPYETLKILDITSERNEKFEQYECVDIDEYIRVYFDIVDNPYFKREPGSAQLPLYFNTEMACEVIKDAFSAAIYQYKFKEE